MEIDYRELLKKYMAAILTQEGLTFLDTICDALEDQSDAENLRDIEQEVIDEL